MIQREVPEEGPQFDIQIKQDIENPNPKDHTLIVKMVLPKQILDGIAQIQSKKRELIKQLQLKEQTPQVLLLKSRYDQFRKLDQKLKEEHRKQVTQLYRAYVDYQQYFGTLKDKYSFSLFQSFTDRGKNPNIKFSFQKSKVPKENIFTVKFNKKYFFEQLKLTRRDLVEVPFNFLKIWDPTFVGFIKIIFKTLFQNPQKTNIYTTFLRSIDLISINFDVLYGDKKVYRYRFSPFQFINTQFSKDHYQIVSYHQCFSVLTQINPKIPSPDHDFYHASRCFIFDDLTDNNTFTKVFQRGNIFYTAYSISKGALSHPGQQVDEFSKKYLWQLYFSTTRLKKFIYTWSFKPFKRITARHQHRVKEIEQETKQIILHIPFYVELREAKQLYREDFPFRIRVQYQDFNRNLPLNVKEEIILKVRDWYITYKDSIINNRDITKQKNPVQAERILAHQKRERQKLKEAETERSRQKPDRQQTELEMYIGSKDRLDRFLMGMLVIVSSVLERNHFTMLDEKQKQNKALDQPRYAILDTCQTWFVNKKHQHLHHYHWLQIHFESRILPYLFRQQRQKANLKPGDIKNRCAEWKLHKINKFKRQWNRKTEKAGSQNKSVQVLTLNEVFKDYIDILLKHFSLKFIYKDIINFLLGIGKNCYGGWQEHNIFDPNVRNQAIFKAIIAVILDIFYYTSLKAFREKQMKAFQRMVQEKRNIDKQQHEKASEEQRLKKEDGIIEQFYRAVVVKILTKGDPEFMNDDKLFAEVTFRVMEYKSCWITRMKQGFIILRIYDDRIDFERLYEKVDSLKFNPKNKNVPFEEEQLKQKLQTISSQIKANVLS